LSPMDYVQQEDEGQRERERRGKEGERETWWARRVTAMEPSWQILSMTRA